MMSSASNIPCVLVFSDWFLPGFRGGGPIRSLANLIEQIPAQFYIITRITDHHSDAPYPGIREGEWIPWNAHASVCYVQESAMTQEFVHRAIAERNYSCIYLNSLFSPLFTLLPLRCMKDAGRSSEVLLAPRGMLKAGALSVKSWKKRIFLEMATRTNYFGFRGIRWHATSETEAGEIRSHFGDVNIHVAPNLPLVPLEPISHPQKSRNQLKLVAISRVSPEKGILEGIQFLNALDAQCEVKLDVYGTLQNQEYLDRCRAAADSLAHAGVRFHGEIEPAAIPAVLAQAHFLYMPTWGENYGHAIIEALLHGVPVIASNRTPWTGLAASGAGWDAELDATTFGDVLKQAMALENVSYLAMCSAAFIFGRKAALAPEVIRASRALFGLPEEDSPSGM
jgi:glycosyltransferase involved in cell wall biosynthesis